VKIVHRKVFMTVAAYIAMRYTEVTRRTSEQNEVAKLRRRNGGHILQDQLDHNNHHLLPMRHSWRTFHLALLRFADRKRAQCGALREWERKRESGRVDELGGMRRWDRCNVRSARIGRTKRADTDEKRIGGEPNEVYS